MSARSPAEQLLAAADLITPMALRVAATLRLADLMADGVERPEVLAQATETDAEALARLLRHLVQRGIFAEPSPGRFTLNAPAELLRSDAPSSMREWFELDGFGGRMDLVFTELLHTVRTGEPAWESAFGAPFWDYLAANPALSASFDAMMADSPRLTAAAEGYDWSGVGHVVDVGGGTGALLAALLHAHPGLRATLVDLPETAARGRALLAAAGLDGRCTFSGQSFFDPLPTGPDVYLLSAVLHDWDDERAIAILRRCAEAAGSGGRVLISESHGTGGGDPAMFAEMDLRMLVIAGGRERSVEGYRALAGAAGLEVAAVLTPAPGHVLIECSVS